MSKLLKEDSTYSELALAAPAEHVLAGETDPRTLQTIGTDWSQAHSVAITFAKFTDGRGYSLAKVLRERYGFQGELRAQGDILVDQVSYLKRCGFNSFALREDQNVADAQVALRAFSLAYQA